MLDIDNQAQDFIKTDVFDFAAKLITQPHESGTPKKSLFTSDSIDDARFVPGDILSSPRTNSVEMKCSPPSAVCFIAI